jgi:D-alanyl-D-alanine carboxypeptidase
MESAVSGVTSVLARIDTIRSRFASGSGDAFTILESGSFDPFGAEYQAAVTSLRGTPGAAPFVQSFAGGGALGLAGGKPGGPPPPSVPSASQVQAAVSGLAGAPGPRPVGGYGTMVPPPDVAGYGNGRIPAEALAPVGQGSHRLWGPAAASWRNVVAAAAADGIELRITDSYRPYAEQVDLAERKGLYRDGGLAAVPGTSTHGWGMAVDADVRDPATMDWLRTHGPRFGWVETTPREPWHWEFRPNQV